MKSLRTASGLLCIALLVLVSPVVSAAGCRHDWPLWQHFSERHIEASGRVVDLHTPRLHSTSEGQSYAMFFALVANDRARFDRLWSWSQDNLLRGGAARGLPAWQWGRRDDGSWGVIDPNSASDADLWFAYALLEAARLWGEPRYAADAARMLEAVRANEVVWLPGSGPMLLPGPVGFNTASGVWRLNPSYLPLPVLRRLSGAEPGGPWLDMARLVPEMIAAVSPKGFVPDWVVYRAEGAAGRFLHDESTGDLGSYDAIRCYLWAGMTAPSDPLSAPLLRALRGMSDVSREGLPEKVRTASGRREGVAPPGFHAALLPYRVMSLPSKRDDYLRQVAPQFAARQMSKVGLTYYDYVLALFGLAWAEQRFSFDADGLLVTRRGVGCQE
jgi:endoglucanase